MLRTVSATRYVTPLREGGSVPAIIEADDGQLYVMKFIGAGQGAKALIAELIAGELARVLALPMPEIVFIQFDPMIGRSEPNPEIQDILRASAGLNLGLRYLSGSLAFDPNITPTVAQTLASHIVWFDAYVTNVDRTARNVNMLLWEENLWLIDHGACLYFHHTWTDYLARSQSNFPLIKDHVLLPLATNLAEADLTLRPQITPPIIQQIVNLIPTAWLGHEAQFTTPADHRAAYIAYLQRRLQSSSQFVQEAQRVHAQFV